MQKTVLVTGASSGIGEATAAALADAGYRVFGGVRTPDKVEPIPGVELVQLNVRDNDSVRNAVKYVLAMADRLDIIVNYAGVSLVGPVEATSDSEAHDLFDTNLFGVLRVTRAALPAMRRQQSGLIINMSSVLGFLPAPFMGLYAASKHALEGLSESLDHEVRGFGVRVVLVEPSFTNTKLDTNARPTEAQLPDYAAAFMQTVNSVTSQIAQAPPPSAVAAEILASITGKYRLRRPADKRARLLSLLRRFAPTAQVDKSLRASFGLSG